jgi:hypothetical protein
MAECNTGDVKNKPTTVEVCNMIYCRKSSCDHVECPEGENNWGRANINVHTGGTNAVDQMNCTSFGFTSAGRKRMVEGYWRPSRCISKQKVAIIIAFRNREEHLCILLKNIIPLLIVQQLEFRIFVVEQVQRHILKLIFHICE